jgi:hypothetical protein
LRDNDTRRRHSTQDTRSSQGQSMAKQGRSTSFQDECNKTGRDDDQVEDKLSSTSTKRKSRGKRDSDGDVNTGGISSGQGGGKRVHRVARNEFTDSHDESLDDDKALAKKRKTAPTKRKPRGNRDSDGDVNTSGTSTGQGGRRTAQRAARKKDTYNDDIDEHEFTDSHDESLDDDKALAKKRKTAPTKRKPRGNRDSDGDVNTSGTSTGQGGRRTAQRAARKKDTYNDDIDEHEFTDSHDESSDDDKALAKKRKTAPTKSKPPRGKPKVDQDKEVLDLDSESTSIKPRSSKARAAVAAKARHDAQLPSQETAVDTSGTVAASTKKQKRRRWSAFEKQVLFRLRCKHRKYTWKQIKAAMEEYGISGFKEKAVNNQWCFRNSEKAEEASKNETTKSRLDQLQVSFVNKSRVMSLGDNNAMEFGKVIRFQKDEENYCYGGEWTIRWDKGGKKEKVDRELLFEYWDAYQTCKEHDPRMYES